jgi:hypothetical protein
MVIGWPEGKGVLGGRCPECGGQVELHYKDKITAEWWCRECGLVLTHSGYRNLDNTELRKIIADVFNELEASRGVSEIKLQPFVQVCDALSRALYNRPIRSLSLRDLEAMGLETYCGLVKRRPTTGYTVHDVNSGKR